SRDLFVAGIRFEHPAVPSTRGLGIATGARDVSQMTQRNEILGVERERGLEDTSGLVVTARLEKSLTVDDMATHVSRLLGEELLADEDRLLEVADLPVLVRERRKIPTRILVEFLPKLVDARSTGH